MAILVETVVLRHPASGDPVALLAGSECPDWAAEKIGNRALLADAPAEPAADKADGTVPVINDGDESVEGSGHIDPNAPEATAEPSEESDEADKTPGDGEDQPEEQDGKDEDADKADETAASEDTEAPKPAPRKGRATK